MTDITDGPEPTLADLAVTLRDLLQSSELYREWFRKPPKLREVHQATAGSPLRHARGNWRVAVLTPKGWRFAKLDFTSYATAANFILRQMKRPHPDHQILDFALNSRRQAFNPPVRYKWVNKKIRSDPNNPRSKIITKPVRVVDERFTHEVLAMGRWAWCPYCRRPTRWGYYRRHHALPSGRIIPYQLRCSICGVSADFAKTRSKLT